MSQKKLPLPLRVALPSRQSGAALVVGLVLMLVMTVLGVSGMNTATLELTMAGNAQSQQLAFQAAETGIDIAISQSNFSTVAPSTVGPTPIGDGEAEAETTFQQTTPVPDASFSIGVVGSGSIQAFHFDVVAVGRGPRNAVSTHTQSFYVVGPGTP